MTTENQIKLRTIRPNVLKTMDDEERKAIKKVSIKFPILLSLISPLHVDCKRFFEGGKEKKANK